MLLFRIARPTGGVGLACGFIVRARNASGRWSGSSCGSARIRWWALCQTVSDYSSAARAARRRCVASVHCWVVAFQPNVAPSWFLIGTSSSHSYILRESGLKAALPRCQRIPFLIIMRHMLNNYVLVIENKNVILLLSRGRILLLMLVDSYDSPSFRSQSRSWMIPVIYIASTGPQITCKNNTSSQPVSPRAIWLPCSWTDIMVILAPEKEVLFAELART